MAIDTPLTPNERIMAELLDEYRASYLYNGRSHKDRASDIGNAALKLLRPLFAAHSELLPLPEAADLLARLKHTQKLERIAELQSELTRINSEIEAAKNAEAEALARLNNRTEGTTDGN